MVVFVVFVRLYIRYIEHNMREEYLLQISKL